MLITESSAHLKCRFDARNDVLGPFTDKIFDIINIQKNNISILIGNLKTTIKREKFLSNPV